MPNPTSAPAGFTLVTGTITSGSIPVVGHITFTPVLSTLAASAFNADNISVETNDAIVAQLAADGTFAVVLGDTSVSNPKNMAYEVHIYNALNREVSGFAYKTIYPTGSTWNLNTAAPSLGAQIQTIQGLQGIQGFSAYQLWLQAGNVGTQAQFLASLQGDVSSTAFAEFLAVALANPSRNWASSATIVPNTFLNYPDGTSAALGGWTSYRMIPANAGGQMTINQPVSATNPNGIAFYTVGGVFISGIPGTNQVPQVVNVPANAAYMSFGMFQGPYGPVGVYWGVTPAFPTNTSSEFAVMSDVSTAIATLQAQTATSYSPKNVFNAANVHPASYIACGDGSLNAAGGGFQSFGASDFCAILPGQQFVLSQVNSDVTGVGIAFYKNGVFTSGIQSLNQPAGFVYTADLVCNQMRFTLQTSGAPTYMAWTDTMLPAQYVPFGSSLGAVALAAAQGAAYPGLKGKRFAVHGDSISVILGNYWQNQVVAKSGAIQVYQNGQAGRPTAAAFTDYAGTGGTFVGQPGQTSDIGCNVGNTFAQDIQLAKPDFAIIELGTNDGGTTIGTPGDPATASTLCGAVALVLEAYQAAVPNCRLMWVVPYQYNYNSFGATQAHLSLMVTAIQQTCALSGVPVANMWAESGIGSATWSLYLQDGVHINPTGADSCFVPLILTTLGKMFR